MILCQNIGSTFEEAAVTQVENHGVPCWKAVQQIGTLFGSPVNGELTAYGRTRDEALARLAVERRNLNDSLWE